jgi:hypothetical protein
MESLLWTKSKSACLNAHVPDHSPGPHRRGTLGPCGLRRCGGGGSRGRYDDELHLGVDLEVDIDAEEDVLPGEMGRRHRGRRVARL